MYSIISDTTTGVINIFDTYDALADIGTDDATPYINYEGEFIIIFSNIQNLIRLKKFSYTSLGENELRYLTLYYRVSRNGTSWSDWLELDSSFSNFKKMNPADNFYLEIKWKREGTLKTDSIRILSYNIEGEIDINYSNLNGSLIGIPAQESKVIKSPFIFKVFKITNIEIISPSDLDNITIKYRYSQDSSKTWSEWEPFTKENITTKRINPIRFFQIEYLITNNGTIPVVIQDINIIGDFQNVNKDYQKSNLFGIRECCRSNQYGHFDENGNFIPNTSLNSTGSGPSCDVNVFSPMTNDQKANLYNPYAQDTATKLLEKLSADSEQVFGHTVTYFATDPDKKGQDHTLHEYQLFNIVCKGDLKVAIDGNNFPDSQIKMNIYDLDLFDSMEAHVTKQQFKQIFGIQRRPSKEDFLYFCQVNRMYKVEHAQQFRGFNNSAVYYKLILKKYNQKSNVQADNTDINNDIIKLTKNTTINELLGIENEQDKKSIANKQQFTPLTRDPIRLEYFASIDKELLENSTTIISKANYDLSSLKFGEIAVQYNNLNPLIKVSDNLSYQIWFNMHNYIKDDVYYLFDSYDTNTLEGWKANLSNDRITVVLNSTTYNFDILGYENTGEPSSLKEETWYCFVLNIDQRQRKMEIFIYKRNVDYEEYASQLNSSILRKVYSNSIDIVPIEYSININPTIIACDMKVTNIRLFNDILPESIHNKILNQYIIGDDSRNLIFADNSTNRIYLPKFPLNE